MALDWTNPGGPALAQQYVQIMHGSAAQAQQLSAQDYEGDDGGDDITFRSPSDCRSNPDRLAKQNRMDPSTSRATSGGASEG